jgi:hypothetical protein
MTILLLWLIETDVLQMPQLHKHFNVVRYPRTYLYGKTLLDITPTLDHIYS